MRLHRTPRHSMQYGLIFLPPSYATFPAWRDAMLAVAITHPQVRSLYQTVGRSGILSKPI